MRVLCLGHAAYDITLPINGYPLENKKIRLEDSRVECGGGPSATAACLLSKWNVPTSFSGVVGNDIYGKKIQQEFLKFGVDTKYLEMREDCKTTASFIIANKETGTRTILTDRDKNLEFSKIKNIADDYDYILVDGDEEELASKLLKEKKCISMIDAGRCNSKTIELSHLVDYVVCSNDFARDYTKMDLDYNNIDTIKKVYDKLDQDFKGQVIITLEKHGSFTKLNNEYHLIPSLKVKAIDSTGAGDIYHGALFYFLIKGKNLLEAMQLANYTSAISVTRIGGRNSIPELNEVLKYAK